MAGRFIETGAVASVLGDRRSLLRTEMRYEEACGKFCRLGELATGLTGHPRDAGCALGEFPPRWAG